MLLKNLKVRDKGTISRINTTDRSRSRRLSELGFLPGTEFEVSHKAPLGFPIALTIRGYQIILGKDDAMVIEVE
ncbi:MAG: ferrous iron transport protein A [Succinivibrionaceae bacterium]|jgi:Fe2+ transport system protein FeoA|nr:ferrous iron transport protein A [Succinivibrionaceae bacterium]